MNEKLLNQCAYIRELLINDPRLIRLNKSEKEMENSEQCILLASKKEQALDTYNRLIKLYSLDHPEVVDAQKRLAAAKKELDEHPLVKEYLKAYTEVNLLLREMNNILFKDFISTCKKN